MAKLKLDLHDIYNKGGQIETELNRIMQEAVDKKIELVEIIPNEAATPALVLVGFLMMTQVKNIDWEDLEIAIPAFLTIVLMPFTYNITVGIGAGFIAHVLIKVVHGKAREIGGLMWVVAGMFVVYFAIAPIRQLLGVE